MQPTSKQTCYKLWCQRRYLKPYKVSNMERFSEIESINTNPCPSLSHFRSIEYTQSSRSMTRHDKTIDLAGFMLQGHLGRFVLPWSTLYSAKCSLKGQFLVDEPLSLLRETAGVQFGLPGKNPVQKTKGESNYEVFSSFRCLIALFVSSVGSAMVHSLVVSRVSLQSTSSFREGNPRKASSH